MSAYSTKEKQENTDRLIEYIRNTRKVKGISGKTLSIACGLSSNYIIMFENSKLGMPKLSNLLKIAENLQIPKEELLKIAGCSIENNANIDINSVLVDYLVNHNVNVNLINSIITIVNSAVNNSSCVEKR